MAPAQQMTKLPKCAVKFCRRRVLPSEHSPICSKHRAQLWKERSPLKYFFNKLKNRAKERGHEFLLTFDQYVEFARKTGYDQIVNRGKTATSLTIHRKRDSEGYHVGNIACVTLSENSRLAFAPIPEAYKQQILAEAANGNTGGPGVCPGSPPETPGT
jgi:hypothetical protein